MGKLFITQIKKYSPVLHPDHCNFCLFSQTSDALRSRLSSLGTDVAPRPGDMVVHLVAAASGSLYRGCTLLVFFCASCVFSPVNTKQNTSRGSTTSLQRWRIPLVLPGPSRSGAQETARPAQYLPQQCTIYKIDKLEVLLPPTRL